MPDPENLRREILGFQVETVFVSGFSFPSMSKSTLQRRFKRFSNIILI
jgi:hypothetical protein